MEYFIVATSFAAPFVSDTSTGFQEAPDARAALEGYAKRYTHPCGLYAAACYESAEAYHKGGEMLARWLSNHARAIEERKPTSICSEGPGMVKMDGKMVNITDPKGGYATLVRTPSHENATA